MVVDEDLIQTQTAEYLTIYGTCENKLLYMYYTTTILHSPFNKFSDLDNQATKFSGVSKTDECS